MDLASGKSSSVNTFALESRALPPHNRIVGYDLARAVALLGMLLVNFSVLFGKSSSDPDWLDWCVEIIRGRAAGTFVVLAGVGLSLLSRGIYLSNDRGEMNGKRYILLKRSLFLLIIGLCNFLLSPISDILHFYAVYLVLGACFLTLSNLSLCTLALVTIIVRPLLMAVFDLAMDWDLYPVGPTDFCNVSGIIGHILFSGCFPVIPWVAFLLLGMWIGRQDLSDRMLRNKILLAGISAVAFTESVSRLGLHIFSSAHLGLNLESLLPWFAIVAWNPMPLFMISAGGTAMVVIGLCILLVEKCNNAPWLFPFVAVGQTTLTLYVSHIILGSFSLKVIEALEVEPFLFPLLGTTVFYAGALVFSHCWMKRFQKGPLEWLMRRFLLFNNKPPYTQKLPLLPS